MEIIESLQGITSGGPCALALGAFDGLHRGHMAVVEAAVSGAKTGGCVPGVFTFQKNPGGALELLTPEDKALILRRAGVEKLFSLDFESLRDMPAEQFVRELLFEKLCARHICCGEDFRFGRGAEGDVGLLRALSKEAGTELTVLSPVNSGGEKISSTRIRKAAEAGDSIDCYELLGRPLGFCAQVVHGNHIGGSVLGTPTINQVLPEGFIQPRFGVYAAWCICGKELHYGVCNIGVKPTVGSDRVLAETWMPEYSGDLYGKMVRLFILDVIRPEKKFSGLSELREEIRRNAVCAKEITDKRPLSEELLKIYQ